MAEFIIPEEADKCPHCGAVLLDPPNCCEAMQQEHNDEMHRRYPASDSLPDDGPMAYECDVCGRASCDGSCDEDEIEEWADPWSVRE